LACHILRATTWADVERRTTQGGKTSSELEIHLTNLTVGNEPIACCLTLTPYLVGPGDVTEHSIERDPANGDELRDITDEVQLEKFIRVLQTAQQLAHKQEKEKANATRRPKTYTKNAPRTKRRRRKAREEYQAAGGKLITDWFQRKEACPPVCPKLVPEDERDPDTSSDR